MAAPDTFDYNRTVLPFTSSTSSGLGNLPAPIQRAYLSDPSVLMAQRMAQQGADTSPVSSPLLGLVRALQGGLAGYSLGAAEKRYGERGRNYSDALTQALSAPNYVDALRQAAATNPDLQGALVEALQAQLANKQKLEQKRGEYDLQLEYDPKVAGAKAAAENPALAERYKSNKATDLLYDPAIAAAKVNAENPGLIARHDANNASDAKWAPEKAKGTKNGQFEAGSQPYFYNGVWMTKDEAEAAMRAKGTAIGGGLGNSTVIPKPTPGPGEQTVKQAGEVPDKPTDTQRAAKSFYDRAKMAHEIITPLEEQGADKLAALKAYVPGGNAVQTAEYQKYKQGVQMFAEAHLRKESGAVIGPAELANVERMYFPQPGDRPEVIAQKRAAREQLIAGFAQQAGPAFGAPAPGQPQQGGPVAPVPQVAPAQKGANYDPLGLLK